jgi:hypothetical protein
VDLGAVERKSELTVLMIAVIRVLMCFGTLSVGAFFAFDFYAPILAARDWFIPTHLPFFCIFNKLIFIVGVLVSIVTLLKSVRPTSLSIAFLVCSTSCLIAGVYVNSPTRYSSAFLKEFSARIHQEIGVQGLNEAFVTFENEVREGRRVGAPIKSKDVPAPIRRLFRSKVPVGNLQFQGSDVYNLRITWGGPLFRWGIEMFNQIPYEDVVSGKISTHTLNSNAVVFIGK